MKKNEKKAVIRKGNSTRNIRKLPATGIVPA